MSGIQTLELGSEWRGVPGVFMCKASPSSLTGVPGRRHRNQRKTEATWVCVRGEGFFTNSSMGPVVGGVGHCSDTADLCSMGAYGNLFVFQEKLEVQVFLSNLIFKGWQLI